MYSAAAIEAFGRFKNLFDPADLLNPGVLVAPRPVDADLRRPGAAPLRRAGGFRVRRRCGDLTTAVHRCVGVGKCRADSAASGGFMCPSYLATRDEKDSTRGRARVLQEMARGTLVAGGWRSAEVREALDLCLSCKACATDCPAGVDMAQYKSEVLYRAYRRRLRPRSPLRAGPAAALVPAGPRAAPGLVNAVLGTRLGAAAVLAAGGMDRRRAVPRFAAVTVPPLGLPRRRNWLAGRVWPGRGTDRWCCGPTRSAMRFDPEIARAALAVLRSAGYQVTVPDGPACCGLTWISTGQLDGARSACARLLDILGPYAAAGMPDRRAGAVVHRGTPVRPGSTCCPDDPRAAAVAEATRTLAELLRRAGGPSAGWRRPTWPDCGSSPSRTAITTR